MSLILISAKIPSHDACWGKGCWSGCKWYGCAQRGLHAAGFGWGPGGCAGSLFLGRGAAGYGCSPGPSHHLKSLALSGPGEEDYLWWRFWWHWHLGQGRDFVLLGELHFWPRRIAQIIWSVSAHPCLKAKIWKGQWPWESESPPDPKPPPFSSCIWPSLELTYFSCKYLNQGIKLSAQEKHFIQLSPLIVRLCQLRLADRNTQICQILFGDHICSIHFTCLPLYIFLLSLSLSLLFFFNLSKDVIHLKKKNPNKLLDGMQTVHLSASSQFHIYSCLGEI